MRLHVGVQDPFSYSLIFVYILLALMAIPIIVWLINKLIKLFQNIKKKEEEQAAEVKEEVAKPRDKGEIKISYLARIDKLKADYDGGVITDRQVYGELSNIMRGFVFEMTGVEVHKYTLMEIREMNMPSLEKVISQYYTPEFAKESNNNSEEAILNARGAIESWN